MRQRKTRSQSISKPLIMEYLSELIKSGFENRKPGPVPEGITIEQLEDVAKRGQIMYLVLGALLKLDLPEEVIARFRPYMFNSTMKTLTQVCTIKELHKNLEEAGIKHQVLKGAILKDVYPSPEMREMSDIDIMIYEESLDKAKEIFKAMGIDTHMSVKHHVILKKPPFIVLEAHWSLYDQNVDSGQFRYYKNFRAQLVEGTKYTYDFSKEDFYVYMLSHMAKHFFETGCGVRNILDLYVYQKEYGTVLNHEYINTELNRLGLGAFEKHMKRLSQIWLDGQETDEFYNDLFAYMLDCGIYGKGENGVWGQLAKSSCSIQADKKGVMRTYFFPPLSYMKEYYPWIAKLPWLLPIGWLVRAVHGLTDKQSKERLRMVSNVDDEKANVIGNIYKQLNLDFRN